MVVKSSRFDYLDILRMSAITFVVFIHSMDNMAGTHLFDERSGSFFMHGVLRSVGRIGVPLFFMMSGALLLSKPIDFHSFFKKRMPRLIFSILLIASLYELICVDLFDFLPHRHFLLGVLSGDSGYAYQLWFLYTTVGIYFAAPFVQKFLADSSDALIVTYVLISTVLGFIPRTALAFTHNHYIPAFMMEFFNPYITYFILGYFLHNRVWIYPKNSLLISIMLAAILIPGVMLQFLPLPGPGFIEKSDALLWHDKIFVLLSSVSYYLLIKKACQVRDVNPKVMKYVKYVSSSSFTIYLFHILVIYFYEYVGVDKMMGFVPSTMLLIVLCIVTCCVFNRILRRTPYARKVFC